MTLVQSKPHHRSPETDTLIRYEDDAHGWALQQVDLLRAGRAADIDVINIADEIADVAGREYDKLEGALMRVIQHLLTWDHQPHRRSRSWMLTIREHRRRVAKQLRKHPGLKGDLDEITADAYTAGRYEALIETDFSEARFPRSQPLWLGRHHDLRHRLAGRLSAMADHQAIDVKVEPIRYEQDSYGWIIQQVDLLRGERREAIDLPHLAQVLAGIAAQERAKLGAALEQILQALLKGDHAMDARQRGWSLTIHQQRKRVLKQIRRQPGLLAAAAEVTRQAYIVARDAVARDLGCETEALPSACPYGWADIMERDIAWPDA